MRIASDRGPATVAPLLTAWLLAIATLAGCQRSPAPGDDIGTAEFSDELSGLGEEAQQQIGAVAVRVEQLRADPRAGVSSLAEAYGELGRLLHAYGLLERAAEAYDQALQRSRESVQWVYLRAVIAQRLGDLELAAELLEETLVLAPEEQPALLRLGEIHLAQGDLESAHEVFLQALEQEESAAAHHGVGRAMAASAQHREAIDHFARALGLQPQAESLHYLIALSLQRLGEAQRAAERLAKRGPGEVTFSDRRIEEIESLVLGIGPHLERAIEAFGAGELDDSVAGYQAALAIDSEHPTALRGLALALRTRGDRDEAVAVLTTMLERYPEHSLAWLELGTVQLERDALEEAAAALEHTLLLEPDFDQAHLNLGVTLSQMGRWHEAKAHFERVAELDPGNARAHLYLALAADELGASDQVLSRLERAVALDPRLIQARQRLAHLLSERGDEAEATQHYRAVVALDAAPPQERALAHYQLGRLVRSTDEPAAEGHFLAAAELFPELWQARFALANLAAERKNHLRAAELYRTVALAHPENVAARQREVEQLVLAGHPERARARLEDGLATLPQSAELGHLLARLLAVAPADRLRDGDRALALASGLLRAFPTLEHAETVAMALAAQGRFAEAAERQRELLARARSELPAAVERLERNLARYLDGRLAVLQ